MTAEESEQVRAYIGTLQSAHAQELASLRKYALIREAEIKAMSEALLQIERQAKDKAPTQNLADIQHNVLAIINHYCPDYLIPF